MKKRVYSKGNKNIYFLEHNEVKEIGLSMTRECSWDLPLYYRLQLAHCKLVDTTVVLPKSHRMREQSCFQRKFFLKTTENAVSF